MRRFYSLFLLALVIGCSEKAVIEPGQPEGLANATNIGSGHIVLLDYFALEPIDQSLDTNRQLRRFVRKLERQVNKQDWQDFLEMTDTAFSMTAKRSGYSDTSLIKRCLGVHAKFNELQDTDVESALNLIDEIRLTRLDADKSSENHIYLYGFLFLKNGIVLRSAVYLRRIDDDYFLSGSI